MGVIAVPAGLVQLPASSARSWLVEVMVAPACSIRRSAVWSAIAVGEPPADGASPGQAPSGTDAVFQLAAAGFHAARDTLAGLRDDILFEDSPAPRRLAPYATAIEAAAYRDEAEDEIGSGRLVLLYDPDGQPGWAGVFRLVAGPGADLDPAAYASCLYAWLADGAVVPEGGAVLRVHAAGGVHPVAVSRLPGDLAAQP